MDLVDDVDRHARQITAGAGATIQTVQAAAAAAGLRYPVDFGARESATVGGTIATNAGGVNVLRYGTTRRQVVGLAAVFGIGERTSHLSGLVKDNAGYHLPSILCGSEGSLGVVTKARLQLVSRHDHHETALVSFDSIVTAVSAVSTWLNTIDSIEAAELTLPDGVDLVCCTFNLRPSFSHAWPVIVLVEASAHEDPIDDLSAAVEGAHGVGDVAVAIDSPGRAAFWKHCDAHSSAIAMTGVAHKFDVAVPIGIMAEFVELASSLVRSVAPEASVYQFGHIGDGNVTGLDDLPTSTLDRLEQLIYGEVVDRGGSISAEHGVGIAKARWLCLNRTEDALAIVSALKRALDPDNILHPNATLPSGFR